MRRFWFAAGLVGLSACVTPSIPIPPPDPTQMTFQVSQIGGQSEAVFTYPPTHNYIGSVAYVYDRASGQGIISNANPDGSIGPTLPLPASVGDNIVVTIEAGEQTSSTCIVLRDGTQDPTVYCQ